MDVQLVYATFPDRETAKAIAEHAIEARTAACVTFWEAGTTYRWEGEIVEDEETLALFKAAPGDASKLVDAIDDQHPYDVPCILPVAADDVPEAYACWVRGETEPA